MELIEIYKAFNLEIKRFAKTLTGDDHIALEIAQETFIRAGAGLDKIRDESKIKSWVFSIAYNLCQDHFRAGKSMHRLEGLLNVNDISRQEPLSIQEKFEQQRMSQCIREKIGRLPDSLRPVLLLYEIQGFKHSEIAGILGITTGNSKTRLYRARKELKKILEHECTFEKNERGVLICLPVMKGRHDN